MKQPARNHEVLQTVLAEIVDGNIRHERTRRLTQQHLPAVRGGAKPCRVVNIHPPISVPSQPRRPGVHTHPYPHADAVGPAMHVELRLSCRGGCHSLRDIREHDEESIPFGVNHHTTMPRPDVPQQPIMLSQDIPIEIP